MNRYILIAYKPSSSDYCRGQEMDRYGDDHQITASSDELDIVDDWARLARVPLGPGETGYEFTLFIDGERDPYNDEHCRLEGLVQQKNEAIVADRRRVEQEKLSKQLAAKAVELAAAKEVKDRALYEELKARYEGDLA